MGLLGSIPTVEHRGRSFGFIPGVVPNLRALPPGCRFSPRCPHSVADVCDTENPALRTVDGIVVRCPRTEIIAARSTVCECVA
jgi:oligopeptide/dipeptide ABC transporter ATP-binding protein